MFDELQAVLPNVAGHLRGHASVNTQALPVDSPQQVEYRPESFEMTVGNGALKRQMPVSTDRSYIDYAANPSDIPHTSPQITSGMLTYTNPVNLPTDRTPPELLAAAPSYPGRHLQKTVGYTPVGSSVEYRVQDYVPAPTSNDIPCGDPGQFGAAITPDLPASSITKMIVQPTPPTFQSPTSLLSFGEETFISAKQLVAPPKDKVAHTVVPPTSVMPTITLPAQSLAPPNPPQMDKPRVTWAE
jgi:hypothetical protein